MPPSLSTKILQQIAKAGLPQRGKHPFHPKLVTNRHGEQAIAKEAATRGPKSGKRGYVDDQGRIWIKDRAHAGLPDHWDVQINDGDDYIRVDLSGDQLP